MQFSWFTAGEAGVVGVPYESEPIETSGIRRSWIATLTIVFALLLIVVLLACLALTLFGMPGNWLIVAATVVYACLTPADRRPRSVGSLSRFFLRWPFWAKSSNCRRRPWERPRQAGAGGGRVGPGRLNHRRRCWDIRRSPRPSRRADLGRTSLCRPWGAGRGDTGRTLGWKELADKLADRQGGVSRTARRNTRQDASRRHDGSGCSRRVGVVDRKNAGSGFSSNSRLNWKRANSLGGSATASLTTSVQPTPGIP